MKFISRPLRFITVCSLLSISSLSIAEERVIATVDGYPIMQSEVDKVLGKRAKTPENRKNALDQVITDFLVQRAIKDTQFNVSESYLDQVMDDIADQNGLTYGQLLDALDYQGISLTQYRKQLTQQILIEQVRQQTIGQQLHVDPNKVKNLAKQLMDQDKAKGRLKTATELEYRIQHILLKTTPVFNDAQAKAKLTEFSQDIQMGRASFQALAEKHSVDYVSGSQGGDLGWNFLNHYDPAFAAVAKKSRIGVVSAPFKSQFGWHILQVTETRQADRSEEQYMQQAYHQLVNQQAEQLAPNWLQILKDQANIQYRLK